MKRVGIVYLIAEIPEAAGVMDERTETRRKTYCEEKSVGMSEIYQARATGAAPSIRLKLPQNFEYRGETICEYKGERYSIIRDYRDEKNGPGTELTLERIRGNAAAPQAAESEGDPSTPPGGSAQDDTGGMPDGSAQDDTENTTQGEPAVTGDTTESDPAAEGGDGNV